MTRAALTFAEIFIVLALIFIIQTVVNFGLYNDVTTSGTPVDDVETLSIRQVPSGGSTADHVLYVYFSKPGHQSRSIMFRTGALGCEDIKSAIEGGECVARGGCGSSLQWHIEGQRDTFLGGLLDEYKVSLDKIRLADAQDEYLLSWVPAELPASTELRIGLQICLLSRDQEGALVADPSWGLRLQTVDGELMHPHPLVITRTRYARNGAAPVVRQEFAHEAALDDFPGYNLGEGGAGRYEGTVFTDGGACRLRDPLREAAWREIVVSLNGR